MLSIDTEIEKIFRFKFNLKFGKVVLKRISNTLCTTLGPAVRTFCKSLLIFRMNEDTGFTIPVDVQ
jgi:hypothetical protein